MMWLSDDDLERIVMEEFGRAEAEGLRISRDIELTLARRVAFRLRQMASEQLHLRSADIERSL
jgi:hypothetical protein